VRPIAIASCDLGRAEENPRNHSGDDGDGTLDTYLRLFDRCREQWGITAFKFHNYQGAKQNVGLFRALREKIGGPSSAAEAGFDLMNDPVCSYSLREAIASGPPDRARRASHATRSNLALLPMASLSRYSVRAVRI